MNLASTLSIYGGGKGSGCNPDAGKCGRPKESDEAKQPEGFIPHSGKPYVKPQEDKSKKPAPESLGNIGVLKITDPKKLDLLPPVKKSNLGTTNQDVKFPKEKPGVGTVPPKEGENKYVATPKELENLKIIGLNDKVAAMVPIKAFHEKKMQFMTLPVGETGEVMGIEPRLGLTPARVIIQPDKIHFSEVKLPIEDVFLIKKGIDPLDPKIDLKPVGKSKIQTSFKDKDGAQVTILKPSKAGTDTETRGTSKPHGLKGQFKEVTGQVKDVTDPNIRRQVFSAQPKAAVELGDKLMGTTVIVERDYNRKQTTVTKMEAGRYGELWDKGMTERVYNNHGAASGYLMKIFGISQKLPKNLKKGE